MKKICDFIARWMGLIVLLAAVFAYLVPAPLKAIDTWFINPLLGMIMFGMGLTLSAKDFHIVFSRPKDVLLGCLAQFTIMPAMAWLLTKAFSLPEELALGVILCWLRCSLRYWYGCSLALWLMSIPLACC